VTVPIDCRLLGWIPGSTRCAVIHVTRTCFAAWACRNEARRLHSGEVVIQKQSLVANRAFGRRGHTDVRFQLPREDRYRIDKPEVMRSGYWDNFRMAYSEVTGTSHRPTMRSVFSDEDIREPAPHEKRLVRLIPHPTGPY
jgi:hypothetical protein